MTCRHEQQPLACSAVLHLHKNTTPLMKISAVASRVAQGVGRGVADHWPTVRLLPSLLPVCEL